MAVTLPAITTTPGLVSIDVVRSAIHGGDGSAASANDTLLQRFIDEESARFVRDCRQPLLSESVTDIYAGLGTDRLFLLYHPVSAVTLVEEQRWSGLTWTTVDSTTYELQRHTDRDERLYRWLGFYRNARYRVTMTVGVETVPDDVTAIVRDAVVYRWLDSIGDVGKGRFGKSSDATSGETGMQSVTTTYDRKSMPAAWATAIAYYRKGAGI